MNKEELEKEISILKERVEANKTMSEGYVNDLAKLQKQLEDVNKPEITPMMIDEIHSAIENVLNDWNWSDVDNYQDYEFEIDYDGRLTCSNISFDPYELQDKLVERVCNLFKEADCPEDDDSQLNTHTVAEKII